ncbi:MAG: MATE family efflux transporter [Fusobacteriaceae bacterium]
MDTKHKLMGTEDMTKLLIKFSLPAIVGMVVNALYNIVDRIYIGRIEGTGHFDIAGVGLSMPAMTISFAIALMVGMGGSTLISLKLGEKKKELAEKYLGNVLALGALLSIFLTIFTLVNIDWVVNFLGASENTFRSAKSYLSIISLGFVFSVVGYSANASIRSDGSPKIAMGTLLIGAILNIILDPIFIFILDFGVSGAAIATIISQFASMAWAVYYFCSPKSGMKLYFKNMKLNLEYASHIMKQGIAPFFLQLASGMVIFTLNNTLKNVSGDLAVAAMTIVQGITTFFTMPIFGVNQAVLPTVGYNYGAKLYSRVKGLLFRGIIGSTIFAMIGFLSVQFLSKYFVYIFTDNLEVVEITAKGLKIYTAMFPVVGFQIISSIYFQAIGKPKATLFLTLCRQVIFLMPLVVILGNRYGEIGVWIAAPIADFFAFAVTFEMIKRELKNLDLKHNEIKGS